jgi:peptidoglycan/LPS O-acetylase OafA/YrhL
MKLETRSKIMTKSTTVPANSTSITKSSAKKSERLYYLDWLRNILIFGVFIYHALSPFRAGLGYHISNADQSVAVTVIMVWMWPWALPLFFLVAGAATLFALGRRSNNQFIRERVNRLLIPYIVGSILLTPLQAYFEALHKGSYQGSFLSFIPEMLAGMTSGNLFSPLTFGRWGYHLWFLAFLFLYSLLALPIFNWFKRDAGRAFIAWLGRMVEMRGGILLFVIPLALARLLVQPFFPEDHGWLDFVFSFLFFVLGYIIYADSRFVYAIRRDRWLLLGGGVLTLVIYGGLQAAFGDQVFEWTVSFVVPWSIILIFLFALSAWCWALCVLYLAMTHLNFSSKWLLYGNDTIMPFYLLHQPVIIVIAYFVVQWDAGLWVKLLAVLLGSFFVTLGLVELLVRPFNPVRRLFGMKPRRGKEEEARTALT